MKRLFSVFLCLVFIVCTFAGCSSKQTEAKTKVRIASVMNSPSVFISHMLEKSENKITYTSTPVNLANRIRHLLTDGECDVAVVPIETACSIFKRANPEIKVIAGISVGGFELISSEELKDISELKDKTIYLTERDSLMEKVFEYLIRAYKLTLHHDVKISYADDIDQLQTLFKGNTAGYALLSSSDAAMLRANIENLNSYNITNELSKKFSKPSIVTYCVIGNAKFIEKNPKAIDGLLKDLKSSVSKSKNFEETIRLGKKHNLLTSDAYNENFLAGCKASFISGEKMKTKLTAYFKLIDKIKPSVVNNVINKDNFFYISKSDSKSGNKK